MANIGKTLNRSVTLDGCAYTHPYVETREWLVVFFDTVVAEAHTFSEATQFVEDRYNCKFWTTPLETSNVDIVYWFEKTGRSVFTSERRTLSKKHKLD